MAQHALRALAADFMMSPSPPAPEIGQETLSWAPADIGGGRQQDHEDGLGSCNGTVAYLFLVTEEMPLAEAWKEYLQKCEPGSAVVLIHSQAEEPTAPKEWADIEQPVFFLDDPVRGDLRFKWTFVEVTSPGGGVCDDCPYALAQALVRCVPPISRPGNAQAMAGGAARQYDERLPAALASDAERHLCTVAALQRGAPPR